MRIIFFNNSNLFEVLPCITVIDLRDSADEEDAGYSYRIELAWFTIGVSFDW